MDAPWTTLEVTPECPAAELKQSYARLLKLHRPDQDPAGFRRLRDAYEWMREFVERRDATEAEKDAEESGITITPEGAFENRQIEKRTAIEFSQPEDPFRPSAADSVRDLYERMLARLESIRERARNGDWSTVYSALDELETQLQLHPSIEAAAAMCTGAKYIAIYDWKRARRLADAAYPHLRNKREISEELDALIQAGQEIGAVADEHRSTLARCLAGHSEEAAENSLRRAVQCVSYLAKAGTARALFSQKFPKFKARLGGLRSAAARSQTQTNTRPPAGAAPVWRYGWVFLVIGMLRFFGSSSSTSPAPAPGYDWRERQRIVDEFMKHDKVEAPGTWRPSDDDIFSKLNPENPLRPPNSPPDESDPRTFRLGPKTREELLKLLLRKKGAAP